jgi:DNA-binding NarL/FixJ family response regulator
VALARGDAAGAVAAATASIGHAEAAGAGLQAAFGRSLLGRALVATGDRDGAVTTLRIAEHELDAFGSERARDEVRRELRKLGVRAEPRGRATAGDSGLSSLTEREHEIAMHVVDRMTNKQIAGALYLSEKTIESHMRNIFLKLEVSSRVEVARAVERDQREHGAAAPSP